MTLRNPFRRFMALYRDAYVMPDACSAHCAKRNVHRIKYILSLTLVFGLVMTTATLLFRPQGNERFWIAVFYYGSYFLLSAIPLGVIFLLHRKGGALSLENAMCYGGLTAFQLLCLYQKTISSFTDEGYLAWTIATLVIIALFNIKPTFFLASMLTQFAIAIVYESANGKMQFLNLGLLVVITIVLSYTHWNLTIRDYKNVAALQAANAKSDELLHNILPPRVIKDLREKGTSDPELFERVSILFTDLVNFTDISSTLEPEYLIGELSDLFCGFDCIIEKYGCTRIKTIGDAYMAVCGLPEDDPDHAKKIVQAGLECVEYLRKRNEHSAIKWTMRVGVHSGAVVAGIVGARKYIYDIFGDTVNIASRMENSSKEMQVNVSEETFNQTKDFFEYEIREPQRVKGKGLMNMYFARETALEVLEG